MQQVRKRVLFLALATLVLSLLTASSLTSITMAQAHGIEEPIVIDNPKDTVLDKSLDDWSTINYSIDDGLTEPTRLGYRFEGWYTDSDYTDRVTDLDSVTSNKLYAKWVEKTIAETYNAKSGAYEISTPTQLQNIKNLASFNPIYNGQVIDCTISLCADINLVDSKGKALEWETIQAPFVGTFEGNNRVISNMKISITQRGNYGLFQNVERQGTIRNIKFNKVNFTSSTNENSPATDVGVIAAISKGTIENCTIDDSTITVNMYGSYVGGFVGICQQGTIENCTTTSAVKTAGQGKIGGIVGAGTLGALIVDCYNGATIAYSFKTENGCAAGIAGRINLSATIKNCSNYGKIKYTGSLNYSKEISPCMAQIVGWNVSGKLENNYYQLKDSQGNFYCDFGWLRSFQTSFCSNYDCGRFGE